MLRIISTFWLLLFMALPTVVKTVHAFYGHTEVVCHSDIPNHIHTSEFDCSFHTFHFSVPLHAQPLAWTLHIPELYWKQSYPELSGSHNSVKLYIGLRAPPV